MDELIPNAPAKAPKTTIKLKARYEPRKKAPGGDLNKLTTAWVVQTLIHRKWTDHATFETEEQAGAKCKELDGMVVDIS